MELIEQADPNGCGVACLAMVLDVSYEQALGEVAEVFGAKPDLDSHGLVMTHIEQVLARHDLIWRTLYRNSTSPWPPEPFAPMHIASVKQASRRSHFVVVREDGYVLDPLQQHTALTDWPAVRNMTGIWTEPTD